MTAHNTSLTLRNGRNTSTRRTEKKPREATPEQKEAAAARRAALRGMFAKIKALPIEKRVLLAHEFGIRSAEEGREFSPCNQLLIAWQCPGASVVGGFEQWRKNGRAVRKGSKAIAIWVPIGGNRDSDAPAETSADKDDPRFILGNVFDISQTYDLALGDIDGPPALPGSAAPIIDNARLLEWGADPAAIAAADNPQETAAPAPAPAPTSPQRDDITLTADTLAALIHQRPAIVRELTEACQDYENGPLYSTFRRAPVCVIRRVNAAIEDLPEVEPFTLV